MRNRQCIKKYAESKGLTFMTGDTFVQHYVSTNRSYFFYDSGKWEDRTGTGVTREGEWQCDGVDNYFIWLGNKKYSSRLNDWFTLNTVFSCIKEDLESRGMDFDFGTDQMKVTFKSENYYLFFADGKFEAFHKVRNQVYPGTWQCDGEENYEIFTEHDRFSSKTNMWEKRGL